MLLKLTLSGCLQGKITKMSVLERTESHHKIFVKSMLAGGFAGLSVDLVLYPIDTVKTRLQSQHGFSKAGGFKGVYRGLLAMCIGSIPASSLFFVSYEISKASLESRVDPAYHSLVHMFCASLGEVSACLARVPTDIVKQRRQVGNVSSNILLDAFRNEGLLKGVYRGFGSTIMRDLPFSLIQMPVWELLKKKIGERKKVGSAESAISGALAGGFAAACTTPLDLVKTRIMLAKRQNAEQRLKIIPILKGIYAENGIKGLFAGLIPRTTMFTIGGFVFFGAYDYFGKLFGRIL